ncbi:MAG: DUF29 domain-containing protein [Synechococcales bacterium]|nr:DUF29 domain-containing protein [Synechococcales bacterium]
MTHPARPPNPSDQTLYEQDYVRWLEETAHHLGQKFFDRLDLFNLIEEMEDMGRSEKRSIESNLRIILMHLLEWQYQLEQRSGSWRGSIAEHRIRIRKSLKESPSLKPYLTEVFAESYQDTVHIASQETGIPTHQFPTVCEWSLQQILDEEWIPN